jgi:hypothetical protein
VCVSCFAVAVGDNGSHGASVVGEGVLGRAGWSMTRSSSSAAVSAALCAPGVAGGTGVVAVVVVGIKDSSLVSLPVFHPFQSANQSIYRRSHCLFELLYHCRQDLVVLLLLGA